jgi:hypothetical protein
VSENFSNLSNPANGGPLRRKGLYLKEIPTTFKLADKDVERLRQAAATILDPDPGFAAYDDKFGSMEFAVNMRGAYFFDTRTGEIWNYIGEGGNIVVQKLGTVARMGAPLQ